MNSLFDGSLLASLKHSLMQSWQRGTFGVELADLVLCLIVLAAAFLLRGPVARLILRQVEFATRHVQSDSAKAVIGALERPLRLSTIIVGLLLVTEFVIVNPRWKVFGENLTRSLAVIVVFWALYAILNPLLSAYSRRGDSSNLAMLDWTLKAGRIVAMALGLAAVLEVWGIHVGSMLAGFGLAGAAVALGAQDAFKNMIAGLFIIGERRFKQGDWIKVAGVVEGTVEMIGLRTTKVCQFDSAPVFVPNSQLSDGAVINYAQMTNYRISWMIGLTYDTTNAQMQQVRDALAQYLTGNPDYVQPPTAPLVVRIDSFGDSAINLMLYCFTSTTDWVTWLKIKEALAFKINTIVADAGSGLAFPSQSLYVESWPAGTEVFPGSAALAPAASAPGTPKA